MCVLNVRFAERHKGQAEMIIFNAATLLENDRVQILTHPYSWTKKGYDNLENFRTLIQERNEELMDTIDNECKHFASVRDLL